LLTEDDKYDKRDQYFSSSGEERHSTY
jgi:hypothetical protein